MEKVGSVVDPQGESHPDIEKTIFIWLDILGFSNALEDEGAYEKLYDLLKEFQKKFNECHSYDSTIISDGIILWLKNPSANSFSKTLSEIGKQQYDFTLQTSEFIRGGISLGSKLRSNNNSGMDGKVDLSVQEPFIGNGLARAVKI